MPSFRAREQGSGESAYRQLRHGPTGAGVRQSRYASIADLVVTEVKYLHMSRVAHQTKLSGPENTHAKSQGMATRQ